MRLIDADELKKKFAYITHIRFTADMGQGGFEMFSEKEIEDIIDNTPTIPQPDFKDGYKQAIIDGKTNYSRPEGEWIDYDNTFYKCPECGYLLEKCCPECQTKVILPKGGAE